MLTRVNAFSPGKLGPRTKLKGDLKAVLSLIGLSLIPSKERESFRLKGTFLYLWARLFKRGVKS